MNKVRKTLVVVFSALFVLCMALFAVGCGDTNNAETPDETKSAYSVSVDVNDPSLGKYTLTAANSGDAYVQGTSVTVTVEPNEDYDASLIVNGEEVALTDNTYTFTVEGDTDLQVNYNYIYVAYTNVIAGKGTVTLSEPKNGSVYEKGEEVTVTVEAADGYELKSLRINNDYVSLTDGAVKFQITGKTYVFAEFVALHTVTVENEDAKGTVAMRANGKAVESGVVLAEGTEVELTVTPLGGNTVKAVYVAGARTPLEAGKATFTLQKDSVVEVVYDTYYTVTLPVEAEGGSVTLSEEAATLGYLDGTELTLTVAPAEGYVVTSFKVTVGGKEVEGAKLNFKKYTFTVTADVTIEVEFELKEAVLTYNVDIAYSNSGYGVATLSEEANDDGTYSYGTELALTVTPNDGFKVSYVTINGNRAEAQEDGTYAITVTGDIEIYVCFTKAARFSVRVEMYGLTGVTAALQIGENAAQAPDEGNQYIKAECYEGQSVTVSVTIDELDDGMQLYYYLNDSERILYVGEDIVIDEVTENVTIRLAAEAPTAPAYTFNTVVGNDTEAQPEPDYTGVVASCTLQDGKYTLTLKAPADPEGYVFDSWKVEVGGEVLTPDETTGAYTFDYNDEGMEVVLTATWNKTINVTLPDSAASNGTVTVVEGEGPYIKGATLTIKVEPKAGYRIKTVSVSANGQAIPVEVELASGAQEYEVTAADDLTVAVEYEAIYTYTYSKPAHAFFTIEAESDEDFLEYDAETRVYTFDTVSSYIITFTLESDDYQFTSITVNGTPVDLSGEAYTYTGALLAETKIEVVAKKLAAVTYTITPEREDNFFSVEIKAGGADGELVEYGDKLISGTEIYIHFTVPEGYEAYFTGSFGGFNVHHTNVTNMNNLTCYVTDNGLYFELEFVLLPVELDYTFPAEDSSDPSNHLPTQGIWTNGEEENEQILKVEKNTMYVNGDPVTDFQIDPLNPTTKFNITTNNAAGEEKHYTLEWFGGEQGFILALTNTTPASTPAPAPAPAPAGRRNAANDAAAPAEPDVVYLVNPVYGDSYFAPYKEGDKDTLVGENKTWTYKTDTVENTIVFTEEAEKAHVSFNGTAASYVFAVEPGHYLFVVGASAYDMTITDNGNSITVNDEKYLLPTTYTVTVTETGKVDGCSYTLKNGEADVASSSAVQENAKLTLTLTLATDYTATVTVNGTAVTAKEGSTNVYEITVTSATEIAITYVAPTTYTVTVNEIGKPEGTQDLWYELKKGETAVASGSEVVKDSVLTLTLKAPEGYTATVKVGETDLTAQDGVYTIPAITAETTITITYTAPVVEKKIIAASGAHLEGALLLITVQTNGNFTLDELKTAVKLVGGTNECSPANVVAVAETTDKFTLHFNAIVDWAVAETGYILSLKVNDVAVELDLTTDAQGSTVDFNNQKTFTLSVSEGKLVLTVSAYVAPTPTTYTVEIVENGKVTGCSVEVKNGEATVTSGGTVPTDATLKVTVTLPQGYTATVAVAGGTKAQEENVYTITNLTGNVTITITYAPEGQEQPQGRVFNFHGESFDNGVLFFYAAVEGYEKGYVTSANTKLKIGETQLAGTVGDGREDGNAFIYGFSFDLKTFTTVGTYELKLVIGTHEYSVVCAGMEGKSYQSEANFYTLSVDADNNVSLNLTAATAQFVVTVNVNDSQGGSYTLKNGDASVNSGDSVTIGTELKLSVTANGDYVVAVSVEGGTLTANQDGTYSVKVTAATTITIKFSKQGEITNIPATEVSFYGGFFATVHVSSEHFEFLKAATQVKVNQGNPIGFERVGAENGYFNINVGGKDIDFVLEWLNADNVIIARTEYNAGSVTPPQPQGEFTATEATLEVSGEKVYFVLSGTVTGLADTEAIRSALNEIYFDLQELNASEYQDKLTRTVTVGEQQDGVYSWTIEFDITELEAKEKAYIVHFQASSGPNPGADLKLPTDKAVPNTAVQNFTHKFTLLNEYGQNEEAHNWGCVAVKIENQPAYTDDGVINNGGLTMGTIGTPGKDTEGWAGYNNLPNWISEFKKGDQIVISGTQKSVANQPFWSSLTFFVWSSAVSTMPTQDPALEQGNDPGICMNHANGGAGHGETFTISAPDHKLTGTPANKGQDETDFVALIKEVGADCKVTITFDWTQYNKQFTVTMKLEKDGKAVETTYTFTVKDGQELAASYNIGIGVDHSYANLTEITRTTQNPTQDLPGHNHNFVNGQCTICGAPQAGPMTVTSGDKTYNATLVDGQIVNEDKDLTWWNGNTTKVQLEESDFIAIFSWEQKTIDPNYGYDAIIELSDITNTNFFDLAFFQFKTEDNVSVNHWGSFVVGGEGGTPQAPTHSRTITVNGAQKELNASAYNGIGWKGYYSVKLVRVGSTLTVTATLYGDDGNVTVVTDTYTGFTTVQLQAGVVGNPYGCEDLKLFHSGLTARA